MAIRLQRMFEVVHPDVQKLPAANVETIFNAWAVKHGDSIIHIPKEAMVDGKLDWLTLNMLRVLFNCVAHRSVLDNAQAFTLHNWVLYVEDDLMTDAKRIRLVNKEDDGNSKQHRYQAAHA